MPSTKTNGAKTVTDEQLVSKLQKYKTPKTAAQIGVSVARLKTLAGVVQVGTVKTGKRGRPAGLFAVEG